MAKEFVLIVLMRIAVTTLIFFYITEKAEAIHCYKCAVTPEKYFNKNKTVITPICSKFEETDKYTTICPYSTMCIKTISTLHLQNGQVQQTITRGCAQQKETTQVFRNRQWHQEHSVQEVYKEGCTDIKDNNLAGSFNTHCYCRGDLCNSSPKSFYNKRPLHMIILFYIVRRTTP